MSKQVALADDAYDSLDQARRPGESFSDVVRRLTKEDRHRRLMATFGAFKDRDDEWKKIGEEIYARRRTDKFRKVPQL